MVFSAELTELAESTAALPYCPSLIGREEHRESPKTLLAPQVLNTKKCQTDTDSGK